MYFSSATATCPSRIPSMYRPTALLSVADTIDLREASTSLYGESPWQLSNKTTPGASLSGREYHVSYWPDSDSQGCPLSCRFHPGRLAAILRSLTARPAQKAQSLDARILGLRREVTEADDKLKRLYRLIEEGVTDLDDVLKDRLSNIKAERDRAKAALERASSHAVPVTQIDPARIEGVGRLMRHNLTNGSVPFRKAYLRSIIYILEVDDTR